MAVHDVFGIDLIRELRLRQWARTHYVARHQRSEKWHPIVLDEMRRRDEELHEMRFAPMELESIVFAEAS